MKTAYENQHPCWGAPNLYDTVEEFLAHCQETFGEQPNLVEDEVGNYYDTDGDEVLALVEVDR